VCVLSQKLELKDVEASESELYKDMDEFQRENDKPT